MARPREFDRSNVVRKAMHLFWKQGYEATSVQDLKTHLGLHPGSLYNTFKDKHALFLEALECYAATESEETCRMLYAADGGRAAIRHLFVGIVDAASSDTSHYGCFMVNSAAELAAHDPDVHAKVSANHAKLQHAFQTAVMHAQHAGEISTRHDPAAIALLLVNSLYGLQIMAKIVHDRAQLEQMVDTALSALD